MVFSSSKERDNPPQCDVVVIEWRYVEPTYGEVHRFIRTHYQGPYKLGRFTQGDIMGSVQILDFNITPRDLSKMLKDELIHARPVFAYPSYKYS